MKAKRRVTTAKDVRPGGIQRGPTPRRKQGSAAAVAACGARPVAARRRSRAVEAVAAPDRPARSVDVDLTVDLGRGLVLPNPILVASGTFGYGIEYGDVVEVDRLGAICCKGTTLKPRIGNITPRVTETPGGMLNSIGLQNPGVDAVIEKYAATWVGWKTPVIVNVAGESVADYVEVVRRLEGVPGVAGIELNISCPNVGRGRAPVRDRRRRRRRGHGRRPAGDGPAAARQAVAERRRRPADRPGDRRRRRRRADRDQHAVGDRGRAVPHASRCSATSTAACRVRRSSRSRCGSSTRSARSSTSRSSRSAA